MTGEYQHSLDNKGRIFIPAKLREELGDVFYITISMDKCLCAYNSSNWQKFSDKVSEMHMSSSVRCARFLLTLRDASLTVRVER